MAEALAEGRSPPAARLRTILKYALKLAGLALVGIGTSLPEASAALACSLVAYEGLVSARHALCIQCGLPTCFAFPSAACAEIAPVLRMLLPAIPLGMHWLLPCCV